MTEANQLYSKEMRVEDELKKDRAMAFAFGEAIKYGVAGLTVGAIGTLTAMNTSVKFNKIMSVSAKTVSAH